MKKSLRNHKRRPWSVEKNKKSAQAIRLVIWETMTNGSFKSYLEEIAKENNSKEDRRRKLRASTYEVTDVNCCDCALDKLANQLEQKFVMKPPNGNFKKILKSLRRWITSATENEAAFPYVSQVFLSYQEPIETMIKQAWTNEWSKRTIINTPKQGK